jgi:antitoxin HicB
VTKATKIRRVTDHTGSTFESFLDEQGIRREVDAVAIKRVVAWQSRQALLKKREAK